MTTETVPQSTDRRDARAFTWGAVQALMGSGLPLPQTVIVHEDGYLTLSFDDLAEGRAWARALGNEFDGERRAVNQSAITSAYGWFNGVSYSLNVLEAGDLIGVPLVEDAAERVEAYMADQPPTPPGSRKPALRPQDVHGFNQLYADGDPTAEAGETEGPALGGAL